MIKKILARTVIIILILFILIDIGLRLKYHFIVKDERKKEAQMQAQTAKKKAKDRGTEIVESILEARNRFLKEKAEKGENFRYESKLEKLYRKQKFNPQFHCEIPDDIKVIYDEMIIGLFDSQIPNSKNKELQIFLAHTYDRRYSNRMISSTGGRAKHPINLWSKAQIEYKDSKIRIKKLNGDCKKLTELNRDLLEKRLQKIANGTYFHSNFIEDYYGNLYSYNSPYVKMIKEIQIDIEKAFIKEVNSAFFEINRIEKGAESLRISKEKSYALEEKLRKEKGEEMKFEYIKETKKPKATKDKKKKTKKI